MRGRSLTVAVLLLVYGWTCVRMGNGDEAVMEAVASSGRCADIGESADQRVAGRQMIAPGAPPLLSFRYYEGAAHHKFGNAELLLDDAGH